VTRPFHCAFTLIELLVVITIMIVLLALLTPALEQAIYQAELAVCGTNLNGVALGVTSYALDYKRRYPHRPPSPLPNGGESARRPNVLTMSAVQSPTFPHDERPIIQAHIPINAMLKCPLAKDIDLVNTDLDSTVHSNYSLWYGWYIVGPDRVKHKPMARLGDRLGWEDDTSQGRRRYEFSVIATDMESSVIQAAHPDKDGTLTNIVLQDEYASLGLVEGAEFPDARAKYVLSFWSGSATRGLMDRNFAYADGSVNRMMDLSVDDERMVPVPERRNSGGWPQVHTDLPQH